MAGTELGSHGPEQKRLSAGSRLAWISQTAAGETGWISRQARRPSVPRSAAHVRAGHAVREAGWVGGLYIIRNNSSH